MTYDFDLFVIGAGSGGVRAARMSAAAGARVAIAEDRYMGGTCVNVGCVPKKLYVYASEYAGHFAESQGFGWQRGQTRFNWETLREAKVAEITRLNGIYRSILINSGAELIEGRAKLIDAHTVEVSGQYYSAERILIATGGWPSVPDFPGSELALTSNDIFDLPKLPQKLLIVGGGYIAVEFLGIFHGLGVDVELLYRGTMPLRGFDQDVREFTIAQMQTNGQQLRLNSNISSLAKQDGGGLVARLESGEKIPCDAVLYATGRHPNTQGLGLENTQVALGHKGEIITDEGFQTAEPSIYAVGDVIDRVALTPVALAEGMALAKHWFGSEQERAQPPRVDYRDIATAVFCQPNIGTVGLSEEQAREQFAKIRVYSSSFKALKNTISGKAERSLMKLLVDDSTDRVVGAHMVGPDAGEIMQGLAIAIKCGARKADFDATIGIHPTAAEEFVTMRELTRN